MREYRIKEYIYRDFNIDKKEYYSKYSYYIQYKKPITQSFVDKLLSRTRYEWELSQIDNPVVHRFDTKAEAEKMINKLIKEQENHQRVTKTSTVSGGLSTKPYIQKYEGYPYEILEFNPMNGNNEHPTQKPVDLMEYLIKTYTNEDEIVLDFTIDCCTGTLLV